MTKLSELNINEIERNGKWNEKDPEITGIETNSTRVEKGNIFFAKAGDTKNSHGVLFCNQAIERGASLVITDPEGLKFALDKDLLYLFYWSETSKLLLITFVKYFIRINQILLWGLQEQMEKHQ